MKSLQQFGDNLSKYQHIAEEKAEEELGKLRYNAEKKIRDVRKRLENLDEDSKEFDENISEDSNVMDKYSQRIYEKVQETLDSIEEPEKITLKTLNRYVESIRDGLSEQDKVLVKYIKLLKDRKYKNRVKTLDKALKRLVKDLGSLENFIKTEYAPASGVENASVMISDTKELIEKYKADYEDLLTHENEVEEKLDEISEIEKELQSLINHRVKQQYQEAREDYENVQRELDYAFSNIRKVFRKYDKYASKNNTDTDRALLSDLVTDVATAMAHQTGMNSIVNLLKEIEEALEETALNLARDKRETAKEDISKFLDGKLKEHYNLATEVVKRKEQLERELDNLDLDNKISAVERNLAAARRDTTRIYQRTLRSLSDTQEEINKNVDDIIKQISRLTSEPIDLKVKLPKFPEWVESDE